MKTLHFSTQIDAPAPLVWETMLDDASYRQWTEAFSPGSYFEGTWLPGSEIRFLGDGPDNETVGGMGGIVGVIAEHRPHEFVSIEYRGVIMDGVDDTESDYARMLAGTHENYSFDETDGVTTVRVAVDVVDEQADMFAEMWPKSLEKLKELAEARASSSD